MAVAVAAVAQWAYVENSHLPVYLESAVAAVAAVGMALMVALVENSLIFV